MKQKKFITMAIFLTLCLVTTSVLAQPQGGRRGGGMGGRGQGGGMMGGMDLTDAQQEKMAAIREKYMSQFRDIEDPEKRREVFSKMREEMNSVLTEEQRKQMAERMQGMGRPGGDRPQGDRCGVCST